MDTKLYTIQEKGYADHILKKGLVIPVMLCESRSLAQHLVNTGLEDPAILEINTEGLPNEFKQAAIDEDGDELKSYMNEYVDYFTQSPIPADHITKAELTDTNELGARIYSGMLSMKENVRSLGDMEEVAAGMRKLVNLGISSKEHIDAEIETAMDLAREGRFDELYDEEDFADAVAGLSADNNGLEQ